ncbi:MAG: SPOR domain-containing protein [Bacteroidales bacterium]|jgi:hypothetical protein|nr:SPOR domain-containing protein [Bacteroidales bacterium]
MNRFFTLIVASILLITFSSFFQNGITMKMDMPDVIEAGAEITVDVTINKGKLTGFARFQQELPYGFTAMAENSANADFSFQDQKVRLIWLSVPEDDEITFSYKIVANERLTGKIDLNGRFSYIDNNERKSADLQPKLLAINPAPNVNPTMLVDVRDYAKTASIEAIAAKAGRAVAMRQQPAWMEEDKMFLVTLLVNKDAIQKFAKIEETVPSGYTAASIDSKGGIFTFKDQVAKFIWMDLPVDPYFTVTYKLIPEEGVTADPSSMHLAGVFSYMINDRTLSSAIVERNEILAGLNSEQVNAVLNGVTIQATEQQPVLVAGATDSQSDSKTSTPSKTSTSSKTSGSSSISPGRTVAGANDSGDMLAPESGIYYRVQIAAGHKPVNAQRYFRRYRLEYSVLKEQHEGWFKYSVGSFAEYKDARDYRVHLGNTSKLNDAFIAAYNNGKRIIVQDALMALNQKWYK